MSSLLLLFHKIADNPRKLADHGPARKKHSTAFGAFALLGSIGLVSSRAVGGPVNVANTVTASSASQSFTVPAHKRLVIEPLTANGNRSSDGNAYSIAVSGFSGEAGVSLTPAGDPFPIKTLPLRLVLETGEKVVAAVDSSQAGLSAAVSVSASGYFVDVP